MKSILKWILSIFIGSIVGFLLLLIANESLFILLTCGVSAFIAAGFTYGLCEKSGLKGLLAAAAFIVVFFLYFTIVNFINDSGDLGLIGFIIFFLPYILLTYILSSKQKGNDESQDKQE